MKSRIACLWFVVGLLSATLAARSVGSRQSAAGPLPKDLEIELALSALPPHLRDGATVYVLNPAEGFEVARKGTNGFHTFVARTGDDTFRGSWPLTAYRDDILYPISFDEAGARANMRIFFDAAQLQAKGMAPQALKKLIQQRVASSYYKAPSRAGVSYMLAPILRTYADADNSGVVETINFPHVMTYAPDVSAGDVGAARVSPEEARHLTEHGTWRETPYPQLLHPGPHGYMIHARGKAETDALVEEHRPLLARLCRLRKEWCLPAR